MPEKPFYSLGMTNACTHLGSREKPSFSPWFCCHFQSVIYFILHDCPESGVRPSPWNREPEAGLSSGRIIQSFQIYTIYPYNKKWPLHFANAQTCMRLTQFMVIPPERSSAVTVSSLWFTSEGLPSQSQGERSCIFSATPLLWEQQVLHLKRGGVV